MRRWRWPFLTLVVLTVAAAAAAALYGPGLLRERAQAWVSTETGRELTIGRISVNLLALSVEIRDLTLTETDRTTPFVTWERLYLALSPRSLWHRAPVIRRIELGKPVVRIVRNPDRSFNFSGLLDRKGAEPSGGAAEPARFSLNNLEIHGGRIEFVDRALATPVTHRVEKLELAIPFVGNLPYLADRYVEPRLSATVNGTHLRLKGELKPFADRREYSFKLKFAGLDLPAWLGYLPAPLPVTVNKGRLDLDLDLTYVASEQLAPLLEVAGRCDLTTLDLRDRSGHPLLFVPLLEAQFAPSYPLDRKIRLGSLAIHNPQGWLDRSTSGEWNVARLGGRPAPAEPAAPERSTVAAPLQLRIDQLRLERGRLELRDHLPAGGFAATLTEIDLDVDDFTLAPGTPFKLLLTLASERRERLAVNGQVTIKPFALDLAIDARQLPLAAYQPYYQAQTSAVIGGVLDVATRLQSNPQQPLLLRDAGLVLRNLELPLSNGEGFRLAHAALLGGSFDLAGNRFEAASLTFSGAEMQFSRDKSGRWSFFDRNYPLLARLAEPVAAAPAEPSAPPTGPPFSWRIGEIVLHDGRIACRDELPAEPAHLDITGLAATVRDLAAPDTVKASFTVQGTFQQNGRFQLSGSAVPHGPEISAAVQLRRIPLAAFAPYVGEHVRLVLVDGALDSDLTVAAGKRDGRWQGHFGGGLGISRFYCLDADHREDLLRWEQLQVSGIDGRFEPFALKIAAIALSDYYARVLLDEQARLNFTRLATRKPAEEAPAGDAAAAATTAVPGPEIRIGKITLQGGKVNFTDRHMARPFSAEMRQLGGRIEGLSSTPGSRAEVDLRGRLRNESPLTIAGTLNPLADPLFLDLKLDFTDIELSPLSPYAGTYIGYLIERGKLNVALAYHVENGRLDSSNQLFIDQFTFGDKVESAQATSLPVRLAIALLKDRKGEIHLDIPVSGDINDPQFSIWALVWQVIRNLLVKAVTSPLALLGALAGSGEDFSAIVFPAGSSGLTAAEQTKLARIAEALRDRPELKIEVKGYVDPDNDPEGYRRELLQAKLRREKQLDLRKRLGESAPIDAASLAVTREEYPDYLWRVYRAADFPKPRNLVGLVKHLPDEELEKLLLAHTKIGSAELAALAQARAEAVIAALTDAGGIPRERVFLAATDMTAPPATAGVSRSRVEFGMALK